MAGRKQLTLGLLLLFQTVDSMELSSQRRNLIGSIEGGVKHRCPTKGCRFPDKWGNYI